MVEIEKARLKAICVDVCMCVKVFLTVCNLFFPVHNSKWFFYSIYIYFWDRPECKFTANMEAEECFESKYNGDCGFMGNCIAETVQIISIWLYFPSESLIGLM